MISYAQNLEDVVLNRVFRNKPTGFYIDVGAHDPVELSVTKYFYDLGWHGINIEPVPESFRHFEEQRPRDINLNLGIADRHDFSTLYEVVGYPELTSLDKEVTLNACKIFDASIREYHIEVRTLAEICEQYDAHFIDFIKIDVEGREKDVIAGADFKRFRPTMLVVEATVPCSGAIKDWDKADDYANWHDWEPLLFEAGYLLVYYDGLNRYYLREEDKHLKSCFSLPIAVLQDDFTLYREVQERERLTGETNDLKGRLGELEQAGQQLEAEKQNLEGELTSLRGRVGSLEQQKEYLENEATFLKSQVDHLEQLKVRLEGKATGRKGRVDNLEKAKAWLETQKARFEGEAEDLKGRVGELEQAKAWLEAQKVRLEGEAGDLKGRVGELEQAGQHLEAEKQNLAEALASLDQERARLIDEADGLKEHIGELEQARAHLEGETVGLKGWVDELEQAKAWLEAQKVRLEGETEGLRERVGELEQAGQHLEAEKQNLAEALAALDQEKQRLTEALAILDEEKARWRKEKRSLQGQVRYREKKQAALRDKITLLKEENAAVNNEKAGLWGLVETFTAEQEQLRRGLAEADERNSGLSNKVDTLEKAKHRLQEEKTDLEARRSKNEEDLLVLRATLLEERYVAQRSLLRRLLASFRAVFRRDRKASVSPAAQGAVSREAQAPSLPDTEAFATEPETAALIEMHLETGRAYRLAQSKRLDLPEAPPTNENRMIIAAKRRANQSGVYRTLKPMGKRAYRLFRLSPEPQRTNGTAAQKPVAPLNGNGVRSALNTPLIEALMETRSLPGAVPEQTLVSLYEFGQSLNRVLSIEGTSEHRQALHMLSRAGAQGTCLGCDQVREDQTNGWEASPADLAQWLLTQKPTGLAAYDGLLLDARIDEGTLNLFKGRLWPNTRIMVPGVLSDADALPLAWGSPSQVLEGLAVYDAPPPGWLDPAHDQPTLYQLSQWPATPKPITLPPTMPSGRPWPKISVVTVTLNQDAFLEDTILSVLGQGYPNLEYIVLDGGSTDNTPAILDTYHDQLAYCVSEPDDGQSDALNKGFRVATGELFAWLNSDDKYPPGTLWRVALAFDTYATDIVAGGCGLFRGMEPEPILTHHNSMPVGQVVPLPLDKLLDIEGSWLKGDFFYQPEVFWTRELWERCGSQVKQDLFYSMDYDLWVRMAQHGARILHIPETLALYRMHEAQKTSGEDLPYVPELRQVNKALREQLLSS